MSLLPITNQAAYGGNYYANLSGGIPIETPMYYIPDLDATFTSNTLDSNATSTQATITYPTPLNPGTYTFSAVINTVCTVATSGVSGEPPPLILVEHLESATSVNALIYSGSAFAPSPTYPYLQVMDGIYTIPDGAPATSTTLGLAVQLGATDAASYKMYVSNIYIQQIAAPI